MKRIFTILSILSLLMASGVWVVLLAFPPDTIAELDEFPAGSLYFTSIFALGAAGSVLAFGDRGLQFIGAVTCVVAFLGLAAFHSTHTHPRPAVVETVAEAD